LKDWGKVKDIELRDWEHYREYVAEEFGGMPRYVFRGHADRTWKLESTLTRLGQRVSKDLKADFLEKVQLKNFRIRIRGLRGTNPQSLNDNELWSLGQHYGLCTPLLDWSESPYIAAYFAFEGANSCSGGWRTIFALNWADIAPKVNELRSDGFEFIEPLQDDNNRLIAQAGLFTKIPTNTDLETWLKEKGLDCHLTKLHIEDDYRLEAINDLKLMNIVGSSIYPDLHGASVACNMWIETLSENRELTKSTDAMMRELFPEKYAQNKP
jgi:hypothetical protein